MSLPYRRRPLRAHSLSLCLWAALAVPAAAAPEARSSAAPSATSTAAPSATTAGSAPAERAAAASAVVVNGRLLDGAQRQAIESRTGLPLRPGRWWYDPRSGLWGAEGQGAAGFAPAGMDVGAPLPPQVSGGRAGVYFNGRNLADPEIAWLRTLGPVWPGRYWLDASGNVGLEGQPLPFANLWLLAQARHNRASRSSTTASGTWIASSGGCVAISAKSSSGIGSFGASNC